MTGRKIGIMGGTFDPFHCAHLEVARAALAECALDHIEFVPAAYPPHKAGETGACFAHRVNMIKLACQGTKEFSCNDIEGSLGAPSYSIDTLKSLKKTLSDDCQLFFIIGVDAFLEIKLWKAFHEVLMRVHFIISPRQGYPLEKIYQFLSDLGYQHNKVCWQGPNDYKNVHLLRVIPQEISSSLLKSILRRAGKIDKFVPSAVNQYIIEHALYSVNEQD